MMDRTLLSEGRMIQRALRALFTKAEKPTYFEIQLTDSGSFVARALTPEGHAWADKLLAEPLPNGDRLVSGAIVAAIAAEAMAHGYLVRFL
jgi:hypothetical protein